MGDAYGVSESRKESRIREDPQTALAAREMLPAARRQRGSRAVVDKLVRAESRRPRTGLVVLLARQRGSRFLRVSPMLREDLLDVVGRSYDDVDHVVLDDVHETMLDPCKSDHPLAAAGVVAQTT